MAKVKFENGKWFAQYGVKDEWDELGKWRVVVLASLYKDGLLGDDYAGMTEMLGDNILAEKVKYRLEHGRDCPIFHIRGIVYDMIQGYYGDTDEEQRQNVGDLYGIAKAMIEAGWKGQRAFSKFEK